MIDWVGDDGLVLFFFGLVIGWGLDWGDWVGFWVVFVLFFLGLDEGLRAGAWVRLAYSHHKIGQVK